MEKLKRYKKGDLATFNNTPIRIVEQLGVGISDFSTDRGLRVSYQWKVGRSWSSVNARLVVHNRMIKTVVK